MEVLAEGKLVTMRFEGGDTFTMKIEGQDTTTGYPTLREVNLPYPSPIIATDRTGPHIRHRKQGKGQEKDRMGARGIPPSSSTTGVKRDEPSPREMGRYP